MFEKIKNFMTSPIMGIPYAGAIITLVVGWFFFFKRKSIKGGYRKAGGKVRSSMGKLAQRYAYLKGKLSAKPSKRY